MSAKVNLTSFTTTQGTNTISLPAYWAPAKSQRQFNLRQRKLMHRSVQMTDDGTNVRPWMKMMNTTSQAKRCHMALHNDYPETGVDAAATQLMKH